MGLGKFFKGIVEAVSYDPSSVYEYAVEKDCPHCGGVKTFKLLSWRHQVDKVETTTTKITKTTTTKNDSSINSVKREVKFVHHYKYKYTPHVDYLCSSCGHLEERSGNQEQLEMTEFSLTSGNSSIPLSAVFNVDKHPLARFETKGVDTIRYAMTDEPILDPAKQLVNIHIFDGKDSFLAFDPKDAGKTVSFQMKISIAAVWNNFQVPEGYEDSMFWSPIYKTEVPAYTPLPLPEKGRMEHLRIMDDDEFFKGNEIAARAFQELAAQSPKMAKLVKDVREGTPPGIFSYVLSLAISIGGGFVGGAIAAVIAGWIFGKYSMPAELIRVAVNIFAGLKLFFMFGSNGYNFRSLVNPKKEAPAQGSMRPEKIVNWWKWQKAVQRMFLVLALGGSVLFMGISHLPPPLTTIKRIGGFASTFASIAVKDSTAQFRTVSEGSVVTTIVSSSLRAEPEDGGEWLKTIPQGSSLKVTGKEQNGWLPVEHEGDTGWIAAHVIKK